ncbi:hypothetical protein [Nannocystis pusilla]|uniref:Uncharacterized protein n=1 Tax=Nannocystis pusilla TaxID=889268 RepID=A0ABS7TPB2_9BACT|nr:hypothetical protein [Nannocystis pusilla]MBZ5710063.1 hypothetical protein [Nannocystis pusilla]
MPADESLVQLRSHIASVSEARKVTAFYRREPEVRSRRDFVADLRRILGTLHQPCTSCMKIIRTRSVAAWRSGWRGCPPDVNTRSHAPRCGQ